MTRFTLASMAVAALLAGCRTSGEAPDLRPADSLASATLDGGADAPTAAGDGLPCDVAQLLAAKCTSCHSATPTAPMSLVTLADLTAPAKSDPSKRVFEMVLQRITSTTSPMPPSAPLAAPDIAIFEAWAKAGAPKSACEPVEAGAPRPALPECVLASDCPGELICRNGTCDVECIADKDCAPTWTCEETRCHPPASSAAGPDAPVAYAPLTNAASWTVSSVVLPSGSYNGTVFDGRYVYFAPDGAAGVLRYDTTAAFGSDRAWVTFALTTVDANAKNYRGTVFDGRFVYFVPSSASAVIARYDTRAPYLDAASWSVFDLTTVGSAVGFSGASFDGRYVYLAPTSSTAVTLRYDTAGAMTSAASWSSFGITAFDAKARSFAGTVYDGRYVYYVPNGGSSGPRGVVARYDAEAPFGAPSSWATLDLAVLKAGAAGYRTGAFDGRYLYLVPGWTAPTAAWSSSIVARLDTHASFSEGASWSFFDTTTVDPDAAGFNAAVFDGRRLVFLPGYNGAYHGLTLAFDTQSDLSASGSWSKLDVTTVGPTLRNVRSGAFDGKYTYLAPASGVAARFESRDSVAATVPRGGSFY